MATAFTEGNPKYPMTRRLSLAYWPNPEANESAHRAEGDAEVDKLTLAELVQFFGEVQAGPTYCMVKRRVQEALEKFPPHIEEKKTRAVLAIDRAKYALLELKHAVGDLMP